MYRERTTISVFCYRLKMKRDDLKDGDKSPEQTVEVLALTDVSDRRRVGDFVAELTTEQVHTENAETIAHRHCLHTQHILLPLFGLLRTISQLPIKILKELWQMRLLSRKYFRKTLVNVN